MASLNSCSFIGNLTRDVELRYTPAGDPVADLGIAVNDPAGADGKEGRTCFLDVVAWKATALLCDKYLRKGSPVYIEGRLQLDTWTDKATNTKRSKYRLLLKNVQFLGSGQDNKS